MEIVVVGIVKFSTRSVTLRLDGALLLRFFIFYAQWRHSGFRGVEIINELYSTP